MPILDLTDEELQGLTFLCANGSGPGINWMLTNAILTKAQAAAQAAKPDLSERAVLEARQQPKKRSQADGLDLNPRPGEL